MSTLSNYANASAGGREERIAKIFAKLNTKDDFQPISLKSVVDVNNDTIYRYLKTIQNAQMLTDAYQEHLNSGFDNKHYAKSKVKSQIEHASKQYEKWLKRAHKAKSYSEESKQQLKQFQFAENPYVDLDTLWNRLEHSLLVYSLLSKWKGDMMTFKSKLNVDALLTEYVSPKKTVKDVLNDSNYDIDTFKNMYSFQQILELDVIKDILSQNGFKMPTVIYK